MSRSALARGWGTLACLVLAAALSAGSAAAGNILFIGNSFTFGFGSPVRYYRADTVNDLNGEGVGGVPALFKSFVTQARLPYEVYLETHPGVGVDWHLDHKRAAIEKESWDTVVMHGYSTLDAAHPGNPQLLAASTRKMAAVLRAGNPTVDIRLLATWPRADQIYDPRGAWYRKPIESMAQDLRHAYDQAAAGIAGARVAVIPVGDAWMRAMRTGVADSNPYDGIDADKVDLWTYDNYHASTRGYYLDALVVFGSITGVDPRSLGEHECSGFELGISSGQIAALQQVAFDQLVAEAVQGTPQSEVPVALPRPLKLAPTAPQTRCAASGN